MAETVRDLEVFHVAQTISYNRHPPMQAGQVIQVGATHNPFFSYYEEAPTFAVRLQDGGVKQLNPIHWLEQVEAGNITPDNLPVAARMIAKHFQMLSRELVMELLRLEANPDAPSRQSCLWVTDSLTGAQHWSNRLQGQTSAVRLRLTGVIHRADASLLTADAEPFSTVADKARRYWRGESSDNPEPEILFDGSATVVEVLAAL